MGLKGKVAVVTGGSQGIGAAACNRLGSEGAHVYVVASSNVQKAESIAEAIRTKGGHATAVAADVTSADQLDVLMKRVTNDRGRLDILVNSAGVFYPTPIGTPEESVSRMIDINLKGSFFAISAAVPFMKESGYGKIVNLSSCAAVMGLNAYSIYCATKAGVMMMTRALALELAPFGINVNAVAPGNTATPMNLDIRTQPELSGFLDAMAERTPSKTTYSDPDEIANLIAFLVSDGARAMHGSTVLIDEGFTAGM